MTGSKISVEDNAAYFFDEGRIAQVAVLSHDRELARRRMALLKDRRVSSETKSIYLQGLLHFVLADRHMAELAVQDAQIIIASACQAGSLNQSEEQKALDRHHVSGIDVNGRISGHLIQEAP